MESRFLVPQPPLEAAIDPTLRTWVTAFMAVAAAIALVYSLIDWRRSEKPTFLLLFLGGGAMMAFEPLVDTVGACWFPEGNSWVAFHAYGRPIPVWLCLCYFFYFGIGVGVTWRLMRRGITRTQLWCLFIGEMTADFAMEVLEMNTDVGPLPTQIGGIATYAIAVWCMRLVISQVAKDASADLPNSLESAPSSALRA